MAMRNLFDHQKKIDILLDSQYTGNKRVWRAENFKQLINIVKFPHFFKPFSHLNTYQKKEKLLQILNPFALDIVPLYLKVLLQNKERYSLHFQCNLLPV